MAEGLEAAHEKDITHRDIKPDNVMLMAGSRGLVKLMYFGLAQLAGIWLFATVILTGGPTSGLWVVICEMVAGCSPFASERQEAVLDASGNEEQEPITGFTGRNRLQC